VTGRSLSVSFGRCTQDQKKVLLKTHDTPGKSIKQPYHIIGAKSTGDLEGGKGRNIGRNLGGKT